MRNAAATWVRSNCTNPQLVADLFQFLFDANAAGFNYWFVVGGGMTRAGKAALVHHFSGELFVFEITDAQAQAHGVDRLGMRVGVSDATPPEMRTPAAVAISLNRLELLSPTLTRTMPIVGRLHYEVLAAGGPPWCVRLDYEAGRQRCSSWDYAQRPLWGKGMLDISFPPIAPDPSGLSFSGPVAFFVRLCELAPTGQAASRAISNAVATLADVV